LIVQIINPSLKSSHKVYKKYLNPSGVPYLNYSLIRIENLPMVDSQILKEILIKEEIKFHLIDINSTNSNFYILTVLKIFSEVIKKYEMPFLSEIESVMKRYISYDKIEYEISNKMFGFKKSYVMGILNVTPDSFSDGGLYLNKDSAVKHALQMLDEGADFIDIGGESTRPGSESASEKEELERVIPVITETLKFRPETIISIDTYKTKVAEESLKAGAKIVNDISGGTFQPEIFDIVKNFGASIIIMHIKGTPKNMQVNPHYDNLIEEIYDFLYRQTEIATSKGITNIFIDPGIGFGKRIINDNLEIIERLEDFKSLGFPILIGLSKKSLVGKMLNLEISERETASAILEGIAVKNGARIIRTHNVKNGIQVCSILNRINNNV
jgi:dihydropteroate synthase